MKVSRGFLEGKIEKKVGLGLILCFRFKKSIKIDS